MFPPDTKTRNKSIEEIKNKYKGKISQNSWGNTLIFEVDGTELELAFDSDNGFGLYCTDIISKRKDNRFSFNIFTMDMADKIFYWFFKKGVKTQHKKFNSIFHVESNNSLRLALLLNYSTCELLIDMLKINDSYRLFVDTVGEKTRIRLFTWILEIDKLEQFIDSSVRVIKAINTR